MIHQKTFVPVNDLYIADFNMDLIRNTGLSKPFLIRDPPSKFDFKFDF